MKSKKIIALFQRMHAAAERLDASTACWRAEEAGVKYTDQERAEIDIAWSKYDEARKIFSKIYEARIGQAVVEDIKTRKWKS